MRIKYLETEGHLSDERSCVVCSGVPRIFSGGEGGVQQIQLKEGRVNGDLGAVAPSQGFHSICE
jgi:hypothetical protein